MDVMFTVEERKDLNKVTLALESRVRVTSEISKKRKVKLVTGQLARADQTFSLDPKVVITLDL